MSRERARIVSSPHFVFESAAELSEVEYGPIVANNAFKSWSVRGTAAAIAEFPIAADLGVLSVLCLHSINHRGREKKLTDICFNLNIEYTHIVKYALKKLVKTGLVEGRRQGKEALYATSEMGRKLYLRYRKIQESCLVDTFSALCTFDAEHLADLGWQLRLLSGLYGQAVRSATNP